MIPGFQVSVVPFCVSMCSLRWSHGVGKRGAKELVNPISRFEISRDRHPGRAHTRKYQNMKDGSAFLVRPAFIANDHMEEDKGRDGLR
jgi:hypothetical protein